MEAWVIEETKSVDFKDKRLNNRFTKILSNLGASPELSVSAASNSWSESLAAYRFMNNDKVNDSIVIKSHVDATLERIKKEKVVLIPQDTTEIDFTGHESISDMGYLSSENSKGFYLHPSIAVTPNKTCLGILNLQAWRRTEIGSSNKKDRKNRPIEEKETYCWIKGYDTANKIAHAAPDTKIISVTDREGDIYELLEKHPSEDNLAFWLVRAKHNRKIVKNNDDKIESYLWEKVKSSEVVSHIEFELGEADCYRNSSLRYRYHRSNRKVKQEVRTCSINLKPPKNHVKKFSSITINAVHCVEIDVPEGEKPVEWLLLTSYPVTNVESALNIIKWYLCRWQIEIFFKILKSGCKVEKLQFETYQATLNCIAIYSIIAWRILYITILGRECPEVNCEVVFKKTEWQAAHIIGTKKPPPNEPPTLSSMIELVARFGGYLGRNSDKPPGPKIMWLGLRRLGDFTLALDSYQQIEK